MAFDPVNYNMKYPFPVTLTGGDITSSWTTANVIKKYTPGQYAHTWDPLWGYRIFKLMKRLDSNTISQGMCVSYVATASVGTITAGTTTEITTSGLTANDLEYQMITVSNDYGGNGTAPEGESSLCIGNTTTRITLHPDYPFSAAIAADDTVNVVYQNGYELAASGDVRGNPGHSSGVAGIVMGSPSDDEWSWILQKGWVTAAIDASSLPVAGDIKVDATSGYVAAAAVNAGQEIIIGQAVVTQNAATASSSTYATIYINVFDCIFTQTDP